MLPSGPGCAPITAAHFKPSGSCPQGSMRRYDPGAIGCDETARCVDAVPSKTVIARTTADTIVNTSRPECDMQASHHFAARYADPNGDFVLVVGPHNGLGARSCGRTLFVLLCVSASLRCRDTKVRRIAENQQDLIPR